MTGLISNRANAGKIILHSSIKSISLVTALIYFSFFCSAQSYPGYQSSSYTGVYGILTNPADILNHRFRADINLAGIFTQLDNNIISFKYNAGDGDNLLRPNPVRKTGKARFNTDVLGPSLMLRLSDKNALAITTRARAMGNVNGVGVSLMNLTIQDSLNPALVKADLSVSNISARIHGWTELAFTYSRQIGITDYGVWKAGVSLKYLSGVSALTFNTNNLSFVYDDSLIHIINNTPKQAITNMRGSMAVGYTKNVDSLGGNIGDYVSFKNPGVGIDIGINYEYRDEMQVYETIYSNRTLNYIWRIGASITDIGWIRYGQQQMGGFNTRFTGQNYFIDSLKPPSDSTSVGQLVNFYQQTFAARGEPAAIIMQLPTTLHLTYDRFFNPWLGIQAQVNIPLTFAAHDQYYGTYNPLSVCITPRAETSWCGLYLPISYNTISGFQGGAAIRLGPLVVGSGSIINTRIINKTKGIDAYAILRVPFFGYRKYKEKTYPEQKRMSKKERRALNCPTN